MMVSFISVDGEHGEGSYWRDYKAACLNEQWVGGCFRQDWDLTDWIQTQRLVSYSK